MLTVSFNGQNAYSTYGILFRKGSMNELLKVAKKKKGYEYDWQDENGVETDPEEEPVFDRISYNIPVYMEADNESHFWLRYNALRTFLLNAKEFNMDIHNFNRRFKVRYSEMSGFDMLTNIKGSNKVACYFTLQLTNDYPASNFTIS